jgi:hypothetical protein
MGMTSMKLREKRHRCARTIAKDLATLDALSKNKSFDGMMSFILLTGFFIDGLKTLKSIYFMVLRFRSKAKTRGSFVRVLSAPSSSATSLPFSTIALSTKSITADFSVDISSDLSFLSMMLIAALLTFNPSATITWGRPSCSTQIHATRARPNAISLRLDRDVASSDGSANSPNTKRINSSTVLIPRLRMRV